MQYEQTSKLFNSLKDKGIQVKYLSSSEYVSFINLKKKLTDYITLKDTSVVNLCNEYNNPEHLEKEDNGNPILVVNITPDGMFTSNDKSFFEKVKGIRSEEVDFNLNFIEKPETFKAVFENCQLDIQELLYDLLIKK